jgi:uncharacterized membrane protein
MRQGDTTEGDGGYVADHRRTLSAVLGLLLVVGIAGLVVFVVASVPATPPYTEFYVANDSGVAAGYQTNVTTGEEVRVTVGIRNNEHRQVTYEFVVRTDETRLDRRSVTLADTERWERPISLSFDDPGEHRVRLHLYRADQSGDEPYRRLRLVFRVSPG